jgi:uncharacterized NAD(P)/FAD-binding protein YdhS
MRSEPDALADIAGPEWPVAIAGGGFSGTMLAAQLARRGVTVLLCDGCGRPGRGLAYSTDEPQHLLNVPAAKMSAWPDAPGSFADWMEANALGSATTFAARSDFGRYLHEQLSATPGVSVVDVAIESAQRSASGWRLHLSDGRQVAARQLVLAQGNQPPAMPAFGRGLPDDLFINDPWSEQAKAAVARLGGSDASVLILGTGLTMIDAMLSLAAVGHRGRVLAVSRRGLAPRAHGPTVPRSIAADDVPFGSVLVLARWLRAQASGGDWRAAVDQLRPHSRALWQSWDIVQQRRFLRHARPYWDVHRHRIAPQIAGQVEGLRDTGRLEVAAGRVRDIRADGRSLIVAIAPRGGAMERIERVAAVFNCTGPLGEFVRTADPLLRQLLDEGVVTPDAVGMGVAVDAHSRAAPGLWAIGPMSKGTFWEMVAVPDIRGQCDTVAQSLSEELETA